METVFISRFELLLDALAQETEVYAPRRVGEYSTFARYDPGSPGETEFNPARVCTPAKEFLFPVRERAAALPDPFDPEAARPFAVMGLKDCDLKALRILDCVFLEDDEFRDPFYAARREAMFIVSSDCTEPTDSCCCVLFGGQVFPESGFDLNLSRIRDGYLVQPGSPKGAMFLNRHLDRFAGVPSAALTERQHERQKTTEQIERLNAAYRLDRKVDEIVESGQDAPLFDEMAAECVECQACTRICPTCHCFYLFDTPDTDLFARMKMWDSCVRRDFARVAGGANPRKILGDRTRHRLLHKFVYFLERHGLYMCVGCGRCIDACAGGLDLRELLTRLNRERVSKGQG